MLIAILGMLGVPLWLLLGWLAGGLWHRHETNQLPDLFKTKVRLVSGTYRHTGEDFPRMVGRAVWAHDILILEKGFLIPRTLHYRALEGVQPPQPADPDQVKGLGDKPVTMQYRLDGGEVIEIAVPSEMLTKAQGPFFSNTT
jgi:hypothetical protein